VLDLELPDVTGVGILEWMRAGLGALPRRSSFLEILPVPRMEEHRYGHFVGRLLSARYEPRRIRVLIGAVRAGRGARRA